jgi:HK97 family phage prohead protease
MQTLTQVPQDVEFKATTNPVNIDEAQGIVECFVAAIGNKDSVNDIIVPGAFEASLRRRKPRVVWGHNWNEPIGKVLEIFEVSPGDSRLSSKMKNAGVGGLYARVQFNLKSERGREAFSNVVFFGEEQEWSIGYKTLKNDFDPRYQANLLKELELYEVSPVLHGANQLVGTLSIKSDDMTSPIPDMGDARISLVPDDKTARAMAVEGGKPQENLTLTLKKLGRSENWSMADRDKVQGMVDIWTKSCGGEHMKGACSGVGIMGPDDASVYYMNVPGLASKRDRLSRMIDDETGPDTMDAEDAFQPHITAGYKMSVLPTKPSYELGFKAVRVVWGSGSTDFPLSEKAAPPDAIPQERITGDVLRGYGPRRGGLERLLRYWRPIMRKPGGFRRCLAILADHPELYPLKPLCAWLHHETTGLWPNEGCHHPGMKNCRRKLRGVVNGSIISDDKFNARFDNKPDGKDLYSASPEGTPDNFGAVERDDEEDVITDEDMEYAMKVMGQFINEEEDFMRYVSDKDNWADSDGDDGEEADIDDDEWDRWSKSCGCDKCGGRGERREGGPARAVVIRLDGEDEEDEPRRVGREVEIPQNVLQMKVGRSINGGNEKRLRLAAELIDEILKSLALPEAVEEKGLWYLHVEPENLFKVKQHIDPISEYYKSEVFIDTNFGNLMTFEIKSEDHRRALDRAINSLDSTIL